ncbi:MAG: hypothetical protein E6H07_07935 [Bacteroidetes bacterium]|nr:MAG: hypothetical protein E6H07_07935 [Bacteroidota bacterium]
MIRSIIFLLLFLAHFFSSAGQEAKSSTKLSSLIKLDLGGQGLGLTYEPRLSDKILLVISGGVGGGYDIAEGFMEINYAYPAMYFSLTPKYYYNRQRRIEKGKGTFLNAGNYIGIRVKYVGANEMYRNSMMANLHWGMQRALGQRWTFNFHVGAGYAQDIDYNFGTIYPAVDFAFSYVFYNSKK